MKKWQLASCCQVPHSMEGSPQDDIPEIMVNNNNKEILLHNRYCANFHISINSIIFLVVYQLLRIELIY